MHNFIRRYNLSKLILSQERKSKQTVSVEDTEKGVNVLVGKTSDTENSKENLPNVLRASNPITTHKLSQSAGKG